MIWDPLQTYAIVGLAIFLVLWLILVRLLAAHLRAERTRLSRYTVAGHAHPSDGGPNSGAHDA